MAFIQPQTAMWILLLFALAVAVSYRTSIAIVALAVSIPLRTMLPQVGPFNFPWLVGFVAVLALIYKLYLKREYTFTWIDLALLLLLIAHSASLFSTPLDTATIWNYLSIVVALGTYFLAKELVDTKRDYKLVVNGLLSVGVLLSSITMYFLITGQLPFFVPEERLYRIANAGPAGRFWGTMSSPSSFSLFFLFLIPIALGRAIVSYKKHHQLAYVLLAVGFIISMATTLARSAFLGTGIMFIIFIAGVTSSDDFRTGKIISGTIITFIPISLTLYLTGFIRGLIRRISQAGFGGRLNRFQYAVELGITNPFGVGQGPALIEALARSGAMSPKKVHNVILGVFAQTGYLGLLGILGIIIVQIRSNLPLVLSAELPYTQRITLLSTFSGIAGYWSYAMFNFKYDWGLIFLYFGLNMAYVGLCSKGSSPIGE